VTVAGQARSFWYETSKQVAPTLAQIAVGQIPGAGPIAAPIVAQILNVAIKGEDEVPKQLETIQGDTRALREADYKTGIAFLKAAQRIASSAENEKDAQARQEKQQECVEEVKKAKDHFIRAHGLARGRFSKAVIEYYLGICWTILKQKDLARDNFNASYASAEAYLEEMNQPAAAALRRYQALEPRVATLGKAGIIAGGAAAVVGQVAVLPVIWIPGISSFATFQAAKAGHKLGSAIGNHQRDKVMHTLEQNRREFNEKVAPPVHDLMNALKILQTEAPDIQFEFVKPLPT